MKFLERLEKDKEIYKGLKSRNSKISFIWDYYKIPIFCIILVFVVMIYSIYTSFIKEPVCLRCVFLNSDYSIVEADQNYIKEALKQEIDIEKKKIEINDRLHLGMSVDGKEDAETLQVLNALFSINEIDCLVANEDTIKMFDEKDAFADLSVLLDKDILEAHKSDLIMGTDSSGKEVIVGVCLHKGSLLHLAGYYHDDKIITIASNGSNMDNALILLKQILKG